MKKFKKLLVVLGILAALAVVALVILYLSLGRIVKAGIETVGSKATQCHITVDSVSLAPLRGKLRIHGLVVGNPEGFKSDSAFKLGDISVSLKPGSFFSDTIVIEDVTVDKPQFTYEIAVGKTNIGQILHNVEAISGPAAEKKPEEKTAPPPDESGKSVELDHLLVDKGSVRLSATILQGKAVTIPLTRIEIRDIGKKKGRKQSPTEVVAEVLKKILGSVVDVVKQSGKLKELGLKGLHDSIQVGENAIHSGSDTIKNTGEKAKEGASKLWKGVKGTFKK